MSDQPNPPPSPQLDEGVPPIEIPWTLTATTKPLAEVGSDNWGDSQMSLFTFAPSLPELDELYPDDKLVYLKFTISVSPAIAVSSDDDPDLADFLNLLLVRPVKRLILDVKVTSPAPKAGDVRPYFISAAPIRREMIETGIVGVSAYSGASEALSIGKSGSTLHESYENVTQSKGKSWKLGAGVGAPLAGAFLGGSVGGTSSTVTTGGSRDLTQNVDVTNRQASEERRDLLSHTTTINNILTLLTTHHLGSPYLRFSVWPRPLQPLTFDPTDHYLWYAELLRRRSNGLEGIQDFYAVALVPRDPGGYCIEARLKLISVLQAVLPAELEGPPVAASNEESAAATARMTDYLYRRYPVGTPVDQLDADLSGLYKPLPEDYLDRKPAVMAWFPSYQNDTDVPVMIAMTGATLWTASYKTFYEVWLDMLREEFESALLKSPLDAGAVTLQTLVLQTCPPPPVSMRASGLIATEIWKVDEGSARGSRSTRADTQQAGAYRQAVYVWNALEDQLTQYLLSHDVEAQMEVTADQPAITRLMFESLANVSPDHSANRPIQEAADLFGLSQEQVDDLRKQGIQDLRGLAERLLSQPVIERYNRDIASRRQQLQQLPKEAQGALRVKALRSALSRDQADQLRETIRQGLGRHGRSANQR